MKPIVEKVLRSGIVDRGMVELLEKWGNLPEGSTDLLKSNTLKDATREHLQRFAEELADEVATAHILRETNLDLDRLRWHCTVSILNLNEVNVPVANCISAVIDRMGRYFFRVQDVNMGWFTPGFTLIKHGIEKKGTQELILEATVLFSGDEAMAVQVTTEKSA